jgi:hypothetical protein
VGVLIVPVADKATLASRFVGSTQPGRPWRAAQAPQEALDTLDLVIADVAAEPDPGPAIGVEPPAAEPGHAIGGALVAEILAFRAAFSAGETEFILSPTGILTEGGRRLGRVSRFGGPTSAWCVSCSQHSRCRSILPHHRVTRPDATTTFVWFLTVGGRYETAIAHQQLLDNMDL